MTNIYAYATERTKAQIEGRREKESVMNYNGKPYRTKAQKQRARSTAELWEDGVYRSNAAVSYHPTPR